MSEMVEQVARAIEQECAGCDPRDFNAFLAAARAAMAAMREPTVEMECAGTEHWALRVAMDDRAAGVWRAMVDAALQEPNA